MQLLVESRECFRWLSAVVAQFLATRASLTVTVIVSSTLSRVANLLAFLIPLKVIILLSSSGVPSYLRFLIDPDDKTIWVIALSVGAATLYLSSLALDALAGSLSRAGSALVLREANELTLVNRQDDVARRHFERVCYVFGALLFVVLAFAGGLFLYFGLFAFLAGLIAMEYAITAVLLRQHEPGQQTGMGGYICNQLRDYLGILSSVNFLAAFGFIVVSFFLDRIDNLMGAILSILLCRQLLQNANAFVAEAVRLVQQRPITDALVFKQRTLLAPEKTIFQRFRRLFGGEGQTARIERARVLSGIDDASFDVRWIDSRSPGVATFEWAVSPPGGMPTQRWLERVYFPSRHAAMEHERFLFRHIEPGALRALPLLFEDSVDEFRCHFYDYGKARRLDRKQWPEHLVTSTAHLLALQPPKRLQQAYFGSKTILDAALHDEFIARMDVAVAGPRDAARMEALDSAMPEIRERIRELPLYIYNPDLGPDQAVAYGQNDLRFLAWGRWVLEPVGYGLSLSRLSEGDLSRLVEAVRSRTDCPPDFDLSDLQLVAVASRLEEYVSKQWYRAAMDLIPQMLAVCTDEPATQHICSAASEVRARA